MTFLMTLPTVLKRTIDQKDLEESYDSLLGFGMIIDVDILK